MDSHLPDGFKAETTSNANGNEFHIHGLSTAHGLVIAALAGLALGISSMAVVSTNSKVDALKDRVEVAEKQALIAKMRTEGFTRALIAKGIDPYPHLPGEDP